MRVTRLARAVLCVAATSATVAGCAQPTAGRPVADKAAAEKATQEAVKRGIDAFQEHFNELGDEHARIYNYLNYGDTKITTEHESFKYGDPPAVVLKRRFSEEGDWSLSLTPPKSQVEYIKLDKDHAFLAPTPWVSVSSLFADGGFDSCYILTAWVACKLDGTIGETSLGVPDEQPSEARATDDGFEITTGALLGLMVDAGFISIPEEKRDDLSEGMRETVVPIVMRFDGDMNFTGFEIRDVISDGDETPLEIQLEYEVLEPATESDIPEPPEASEVTVISDPTAEDQFWDKFNDRTPEN